MSNNELTPMFCENCNLHIDVLNNYEKEFYCPLCQKKLIRVKGGNTKQDGE
jgi:predicted RNA-binding Zn-ribbon protein involved in translation (DUF1610 family)